MNKFILVVFMFISSASFAIDESTFVLTETKSEYYKTQCKSNVKNYYSYVQNLLGNNLTDAEKSELVLATQKELFLNEDTKIESDIPSLAQQDYKVKDYLDNISLLYGKLDNVEIKLSDDDIKVSNMYYNDDQSYYMVAFVNRQIIDNTSNDDKIIPDRKLVDIYFGFSPNGSLRIYSIQNHKEGVFDRRTPVPIVSEEGGTKPVNQTKPCFVFDIKPHRADIIIDGVNIFNDGGQIPTPPGNHTIEIICPNFYPEKFDVNVDNTGVIPIEMKLTKKQGYLAINSIDPNIEGAEVYVDGDMVGNIPLSDYIINIGSHEVYINGGSDFQKTFRVTITDGNVTFLNIKANSNPFAWSSYRSVEFAIAYPALYVKYPQRNYIKRYPSDYWRRTPEQHRIFEDKKVGAIIEYRKSEFKNVSKGGFKHIEGGGYRKSNGNTNSTFGGPKGTTHVTPAGLNGNPHSAPGGLSGNPHPAAGGLNGNPHQSPSGLNGNPHSAPGGLNGNPHSALGGFNGNSHTKPGGLNQGGQRNQGGGNNQVGHPLNGGNNVGSGYNRGQPQGGRYNQGGQPAPQRQQPVQQPQRQQPVQQPQRQQPAKQQNRHQ